jgi:hypothetical protein
VEKSTQWAGPEQAAYTTPESVGISCARGVLSQYDIHREKPKNFRAGAHYAEGYYVFPQIRRDLGDTE